MNRHKGLSFSEFVGLFDNTEFIQEISSVLGVDLRAQTPRSVSFLQILSIIMKLEDGKPFDFGSSKEFDARCNLGLNINEQVLQGKLSDELKSRTFDVSRILALSLLILSYIFARFLWRAEMLENTWKWLIERSKDVTHSREKGKLILDYGVAIFVYDTKQKLSNTQYSLFDFLSWLYADYVILQEMNIFKEKRGTSIYSRPTSWFSLDQDVYRIERDYEPRFRNSRFNSCISILSDLNLCKQIKDHHTLTSEGESILKELLGQK